MTRGVTICFTAADQRSFASLSGDFNPVHLDPSAARRTAAGEPIVHGMHLLLRALNEYFAHVAAPPRVDLDATFVQPAVPRERIRIDLDVDGAMLLHADGDLLVARANVSPAAEGVADPAAASDRRSRQTGRLGRTPKIRTLADLVGAHGSLGLMMAGAVRRKFPRVASAIGAEVTAALAGISRLVGMECPGRDSLLSSIRVVLVPHAHPDSLQWRVSRVDRRFSLVRIEIGGRGISGTVDAFLGPPAAKPSTIADAARLVEASEFAGQRALIVGGSRGLGAAAAAVIAAGGGLPIVTFASGAAEAAALARDGRSTGRQIERLHVDLTSNDSWALLQRAARRFKITHLYYFATPKIFARRRAPFDDALFESFSRFYVSGFARACASVCSPESTIDVFYPSSTALDETRADLAEYAAAKAAGESLCGLLERSTKGLRILVKRLPRISTDQTTSVVPARSIDPLTAAVPIVREMHQRWRKE